MKSNSKKYIILYVYLKDDVIVKDETIAYGPYDTLEAASKAADILGTQFAEMIQSDPDNYCVEINGKPVDNNFNSDINLEKAHMHTIVLDIVELYVF